MIKNKNKFKNVIHVKFLGLHLETQLSGCCCMSSDYVIVSAVILITITSVHKPTFII